MKKSIKLEVSLNKEQLPEQIEWSASDSPAKNKQTCKAFMLSLWDGEQKNTFRMDLWTNKMQIDEMNFFFYQSLMTMADTFKRATNNAEGAEKIKNFANELAEDLKILKQNA